MGESGSQRRLKVLIAIEASRLDGPIRNLLYALELLRASVDFVIVTYVRPGSENNDLVARLRADGYALRVIAERGRFSMAAMREFWRILREQRFDVIQVHHTKSRLFAVVGCRLFGIASPRRLLFFFHGETWTNKVQKLYNRLDRMLFRLAERVVVVTPAQVPLLSAWGVRPERIVAIANVIPAMPPGASVVPAPDGRARLMTAGRFSAEKGHRLLIEAMRQLKLQGRSNVTLDIYGDGPELPALTAQISAGDLESQVIMRGYCKELQPLYGRYDLFVLPSLSEGLPNVLLEAAAAGLPMVATAVGGVPALFADGAEARLVPAGDAGALAAAIAEFIDAPAGYALRAARARDKVVAQYSPRAKAAAMLNLYNELSGETSS